MTTAAAAIVVDPATTTPSAAAPVTTPVPQAAPAFDATDQKTWSGVQRDTWNRTGEQPTTADSATAAKKDAVADSAPPKDKTAASASDSATDTTKQPHLKTKEDTAQRFREITDENKTLKQRLDALERAKPSDTRDTKQASQPAAEVYKPLDDKEYFKANPKATYEDFIRASGKHEGVWAARQEIAADHQRKQQAEAQKEFDTRIAEAKTRYADFEVRIQPAIQQISNEKEIPYAVRAVINESPCFVDLMYVLAEPKALADVIQSAKTNPAAAIRKIVLTEQLVMAELAKAKTGKDGARAAGEAAAGRDASGKFVSSEKPDAVAAEPKPRAPKPPSEVGGRGTASEDALRTAAAAGNFKDFEAEEWRRKKASRA